MNRRGSVLVLLIVVIALLSALGASLLNTVFLNYGIETFNRESKQAFYLAENGLNVSYVNACNLIDEAVDDSLDMADLYLFDFPADRVKAESIFYNNYKLFIESRICGAIKSCGNPFVEVRNSDSLAFRNNLLSVAVRSSYIHTDGLEKLTRVNLIISVPRYDDVVDGVYDIKDYLEFSDWK